MSRSELKEVATATDGRSKLYERGAARAGATKVMQPPQVVVPRTEPDRTGARPPGEKLGRQIVVSGPEMLPPVHAALAPVDWPGPARREAAEPLRVMVAMEAREGQMESLYGGMVRAMPSGVEWSLAAWVTGEEGDLARLRRHGEVIRLPGDGVEAWYAFRQMAFRFRPHLVHAHHHIGAEWGQLCGLPVVVTIHQDDPYCYGAQYADVSMRTSTAFGTADYTIVDLGPERLRLYDATAYPEVDVVMLCRGPVNVTALACERLFRARNLPCRVTLVDATDGDLVAYLASWLAMDHVQIAQQSGGTIFDAWACAAAPRPWAFLLDDATWVDERGLFPLLREERRRGNAVVVLPKWVGREPSAPGPGLYPKEIIARVREQASLHRGTFFDTYCCESAQWQSV